MKKFLSLVLALVMTMSLVTISAGATDFADDADINHQEAVTVLSEAGIITGMGNNSFNPDGPLTREQAAKILAYVAMGADVADKLSVTTAPFADVAADRWSAPFISYGVSAGILAGVGDNKFAPAAALTGHAFAKMMLGALEIEGAFTGTGWEIAVAAAGDDEDVDLFDGLDDVKLSAPLTREHACQMALNALVANPDGDKVYTITATKASGGTEKTYEFDTKAEAQSFRNTLIVAEWHEVGVVEDADTSTDTLLEDVHDISIATDIITDAFDRPATVYTHKDWDGKLIFADKADYTIVAEKAKLLSKLIADKDLEDEIETGYADATYQPGTVIEFFMDADTDTKVAKLISYSYEALKLDDIEKCDADDDEDAIEDGATYKATLGGEAIYDIQVPGIDLADHEDDDYVIIAKNVTDVYSVKDYELYFAYDAEIANGEVEMIDAGKSATIDDTKYLYANGVAGDVPAPGDEYDFYLDPNGFVVRYEKAKDAAAALEDVYYLSMIWREDANTYGSTEYEYFAQLVALDGTVKEVELEEYAQNVTDTPAYNNGSTSVFAKGSFVTISDNAWDNGKTDGEKRSGKKDNDKFDLKTWNVNAADEKDFDLDVIGVAANTDLKTSTTKLTATTGVAYRLNSATQYLLIADQGKDLDVLAKTGGIALEDIDDLLARFVITKQDKTEALYVILVKNSGDADESTIFNSDDVVFFKNNTKVATAKDYYVMTAYAADGSKSDIKIANDQSIENGGKFYEIATNADGYYEVKDAKVITLKAAADWKTSGGYNKADGVVTDAKFVELYTDLLTIAQSENGNGIIDIPTADAAFVDLHDKDGADQYSKAISSLSALADLIDDEKILASSTELQLNIDESGAVTILLTKVGADTVTAVDDADLAATRGEEGFTDLQTEMVTKATVAQSDREITLTGTVIDVTRQTVGAGFDTNTIPEGAQSTKLAVVGFNIGEEVHLWLIGNATTTFEVVYAGITYTIDVSGLTWEA